MTKLTQLCAGALAAGAIAISSAQAAIINFATDGNPGEVVGAFSSAGSARDVYQFGAPNSFSFNGSIVDPENGVGKFFLLDSAVDGLTLFGVYDSVNDGSGGRVNTNLDFAEADGSAGQGQLLLRDDNPGNDFYPGEGPINFAFDQQWSGCCTDGWVISVDFDADLDLTAAFSGIQGLNEFVFLSLNPDNSVSELAVSGNTFRLFTSGADIGEVPLPAALPLGAVGFAGLMGVARRRRKA